MIWRLIRYYRQICIWLRIRHHREHPAYQFPYPVIAEEFYRAIIPLGYVSINFPYCYVYPGQIFSARRLEDKDQIHIRYWANNTFTGHQEHNFEFNLGSHMRGRDVVGIDTAEQQRIIEAVNRFKGVRSGRRKRSY